jgi:hypothetical protein
LWYVVFLFSRCPYSLASAKIELLIQDIQNEFDTVLDSGEFHKFKDILGELIKNFLQNTQNIFVLIFSMVKILRHCHFLNIDKYSGILLHPNHWIMTTARRNIIQYLCYCSNQVSRAFSVAKNKDDYSNLLYY